jgi:hypothetical protein
MNSAKEKAEKLVSDFYSINCKLIEVKYGYDMGNRYDLVFPKCKQCALIAVEEIIDVADGLDYEFGDELNFWKDVKQEIEKL